MSRPIHIGAATCGKPHEERIEALDKTDRIGVGVIGQKRRQARGLPPARFGDEQEGTLAPQIGNQLRKTRCRFIAGTKDHNRIGAGH